MKILSICIPTYNRCEQLEELVKSILSVESDNFEVVVTNNCSTDGTLEMLDKIKDDRLVVYTNNSPEPAYYNMILSIFNANGKYALYCNDRDVIYTERLLSFIEFLKNHDYSYIHIARCHGTATYDLIEYEKGFDSLIHHPYCEHPTGMIFNVELMKKNLNKEDYRQYVQDIYTWCFLKRDLVVYDKTAEYDNYLWGERPSIYKVQSASGSIYKRQLFFDTEKVIDFMNGVVKHLIGNPYFSLTSEQQKYLVLDIFVNLSRRVMWKKIYYADKRECAHYGIKPKFISYHDMRESYRNYFAECDSTLKHTVFFEELKEDWNKKKNSILNRLFIACLRCDASILLKNTKRFLNPHYNN